MELDAVGMANAGEIRYRLVQQLLREGAKRAAARFHVACADADGNVELLMQAGFMRYGEERVLFRATGRELPEPWPDDRAAGCGIRPTTSLDALPLARLYAAATPAPVARLEAIRLADWERQGTHWRVPRSSLTPILRFADVEGFVQATPDGGKDGTQLDGFLQIGVAKEDQPHYLKLIARPEANVDRPRSTSVWARSRHARPRAATSATTAASSPRSGPTNHRSTDAWRRRASTRSPASTC